jgi:uncharacterized protein (DUF427 family)
MSTPLAGKIEDARRRVRVLFNKKWIADTINAKFVWEHAYFPVYYLPSADVQTQYLEKLSATENGEGNNYRLTVGKKSTNEVVWYENGKYAGLVRIKFGEMGMSLLKTIFNHRCLV